MSNHPHPPPQPGANLPPGQAYAPTQPPRRKSWFARHKILTGLLGLVVLVMILGALGGGDDESPGAAAQTSAASTGAGEEGTGSSVGSQGSTADELVAEEEEPAPEEPVEEEETAPAEQEQEAAAGVGDLVPVGEFAVTVTGTESGLARVGDDLFGEDAQGQFVKVFVTVENTGSSAEYFFDSEQKLVDEQDRQHSTSSSSWLLDEESLFLAEINPGNRVEGVLLYDIPEGAQPTALDLRGSVFGSVVRVGLDG